MYTIPYLNEKARNMRRISRCLNPQLVEICLQSFQVDKINDIFLDMLPEHLQSYCRVASFVRGKLTISVRDAAFATELRYLIPTIRDCLRRDHQLYQLIQCDIMIESPHAAPVFVSKDKKARKVSQKAKKTVQSLAESVDYPPLKKAIKQWADHLESKE
jgi:hypothetical protein